MMTIEEAIKMGAKILWLDTTGSRYPIGKRDPDAPYPSRLTRRVRAGQLGIWAQYRKELEIWYKKIGKPAGWRKIYFLSTPWPPKANLGGPAHFTFVEPRTPGAQVGWVLPGVDIAELKAQLASMP